MILQRHQSVLVKLSGVALATAFAALAGCGDVRVDSIEKVDEEGDFVQRTPPPSDPSKKPSPPQCGFSTITACSDLADQSFAFGFDCGTRKVFALENGRADDPQCEDMQATCDAYAAAHPDASVACMYGSSWIYRKELSPGACSAQLTPGSACADACGTGSYKAEGCNPGDWGMVLTEDLSCGDALENCLTNSLLNPTANIQCWFDGRPLYEQETTLGACSAF